MKSYSTIKLIFMLVIFFVCFSNTEIFCKEVSADESIVLEQIKKVEHSDWQDKHKMINNLRQNKTIFTETEKKILLNMYDKESHFEEEFVNKLTRDGISSNEAINDFYKKYRYEGYTEYFVAFTKLIHSFKEVRAIPSLLRGLYYYSGDINPNIIVDIGDEAIDPLLDCLNSNERSTRVTVYRVLLSFVAEDIKIRDTYKVDKIKQALLKALFDEDMDIRSAAVFGLAAFPEEDVLKKLEEVSRTDSYSYFSKHENKIKYPIREDAKRIINQIKKKMRSNPIKD